MIHLELRFFFGNCPMGRDFIRGNKIPIRADRIRNKRRNQNKNQPFLRPWFSWVFSTQKSQNRMREKKEPSTDIINDQFNMFAQFGSTSARFGRRWFLLGPLASAAKLFPKINYSPARKSAMRSFRSSSIVNFSVSSSRFLPYRMYARDDD